MDFIAVIVFVFLAGLLLVSFLNRGNAQGRMTTKVYRELFAFHLFMSVVYYLYATFNRSDSKAYYQVSSLHEGDWLDLYGTGTTFIRFLAYPFTRVLQLSYEGSMALFAGFGFLGFVFFYIFIEENLKYRHSFMNLPLLKTIFFLPNLHFWSASLGKGSVIFLGIGMFFYGISKPLSRYIYIAIGALLIYHIRPHILLIILGSCAVGFTFSSKNIGYFARFLVVTASAIGAYYVFGDALALVDTDQETFFSEGVDFSHLQKELGKANSGLDISNYSYPMLIFTFLYRPLFIDATGALGIFVSFENVFLLLLTIHFVRMGGVKYLIAADFITKSAFVSFFVAASALAQISGNLGIAIRQKSQVMMLFLFVVIKIMDDIRKERRAAEKARQIQQEETLVNT